MHEWAIAVERFSGRLSVDLKGEEGPPPVLDFFKTISKAMGIEEQDGVVAPELLDTIAELRKTAIPFLVGGVT